MAPRQTGEADRRKEEKGLHGSAAQCSLTGGVSALPIHDDVIGVRLEVAPGSIVEVRVPPYEPNFAIELVRPVP